jgi:hypothetical protein
MDTSFSSEVRAVMAEALAAGGFPSIEAAVWEVSLTVALAKVSSYERECAHFRLPEALRRLQASMFSQIHEMVHEVSSGGRTLEDAGYVDTLCRGTCPQYGHGLLLDPLPFCGRDFYGLPTGFGFLQKDFHTGGKRCLPRQGFTGINAWQQEDSGLSLLVSANQVGHIGTGTLIAARGNLLVNKCLQGIRNRKAHTVSPQSSLDVIVENTSGEVNAVLMLSSNSHVGVVPKEHDPQNALAGGCPSAAMTPG